MRQRTPTMCQRCGRGSRIIGVACSGMGNSAGPLDGLVARVLAVGGSRVAGLPWQGALGEQSISLPNYRNCGSELAHRPCGRRARTSRPPRCWTATPPPTPSSTSRPMWPASWTACGRRARTSRPRHCWTACQLDHGSGSAVSQTVVLPSSGAGTIWTGQCPDDLADADADDKRDAQPRCGSASTASSPKPSPSAPTPSTCPSYSGSPRPPPSATPRPPGGCSQNRSHRLSNVRAADVTVAVTQIQIRATAM